MTACASCGFEADGTFKFCPSCGTPLAPAPVAHDVRKVVTALFCDMVGSTTLGERHDPEVLRPLIDRYFAEMRVAVERHGGRVHKFIGDAVSAVFGLPKAHEDDALRAVRAGVEMQERLAALNATSPIPLAIRVGITTGEVLVPADDLPIIGDAMNTASRLQTGATPGDVLIGDPTWRLVRDAVVAEPVEPLVAKGKAEPVPAWRVVRVVGGSPQRARRLDAPMVGRERESTLLIQAYERAVSDRACQLFTVLGTAGAGKSRLVEETIARFDGAEIIVGRCLPYGDDITFFPIVEAMKQALGIADFDEESVVREAILGAVKDDEHAETITANLAKLLAAGEGGSPEETFWAIRRLFEIRGQDRPLVVVFDDIHWGEATFLDLIEHIADWSRDASILLLCMARPDLLDIRPSWSGGKTNASTISLAPLSPLESAELISHLLGSSSLGPTIQARITGAAEGNPLFVEEMLRMFVDEGLLTMVDDQWVPADDLDQARVPPTISALLSARLDLLSPAEHAVVERASVVGRTFHRGALASLWPEAAPGEIETSLRSLVRKELIAPERSQLPGHDAFRFRHLLIRDAAYDQVPKSDRAKLHAGFADWLEGVAGDRIAEQEDVVAYHLEEALRYRAELGMSDERDAELASRAAERLRSAGHRASARSDYPAAAGLFERAIALMPTEAEERARTLLALGVARFEEGRFGDAGPALELALASARVVGDRGLELRAAMQNSYLGCFTRPEQVDLGRLRSEVEQAVRILLDVGDESGLSFAYAVRATVAGMEGRLEESRQASESSIAHGRKASLHPAEALGIFELGYAMLYGVTPVAEALERCMALVDESGGNRLARSVSLSFQAALEAMQGDHERARDHLAEGSRTAKELGLGWNVGIGQSLGIYVEMLAGEPAAAELHARTVRKEFEATGDRWYLAIADADLARTLCDQGRFEEALALAESFDQNPAPSDLEWLIKAADIRGVALAGCGRVVEAEPFAREAMALAHGTEFLNLHGDSALDLARIQLALGKPGDAFASAEEAKGVFDRKGNVVSAGQAAAFLAAVAVGER